MPERLTDGPTIEQAKESIRLAKKRRENAIAEIAYLDSLRRNPLPLDGSTVIFIFVTPKALE